MQNHFQSYFENAPCPCYWLGKDGTLLQNQAANTLQDAAPATVQLVKLLAPLAATPSLANSPQMQTLADILRISGLCAVPIEGGVLAMASGGPASFNELLTRNLREPVSNIFAVLPLLAKRMDDNERHYVEEIQQNCYALLRLACNMESTGALKSPASHARALDLASLAASVCDGAGSLCKDAGVPISANMPEEPVVVMGDARLFGDVLLNLLRNALQYTRDGNVIGVSLKTVGKNAVLTVKDRGLGIKEENLPHIFEAFFSADPYADTDERPGAGLGLCVVRDVAAAFGGTVTAESHFGEYTRIHVSLPLADETADVLRSDTADYLLNRYSPMYVQLSGYCRMPAV